MMSGLMDSIGCGDVMVETVDGEPQEVTRMEGEHVKDLIIGCEDVMVKATGEETQEVTRMEGEQVKDLIRIPIIVYH